MAIKISEVTVNPTQVTVGQTFTVTIAAVDVTWEVIKDEFQDWNEINTELSNWKAVLNYH